MTSHPIALIILDGWGSRGSLKMNAIGNAKTPTWNNLLENNPHTTLTASGLAVGLPEGQMGNSEVGHLTMGAGRVVFQDLTRISEAIKNKSFQENPVLLDGLETAAKSGRSLHLLGLISPGGVHSHEEHFYALLELAAFKKVKTIWIHAFLDGRDTPPKSALESLSRLQNVCDNLPQGCSAKIASLSGRYYAMDRDKRFERTKLAYELLTEGSAPLFAGSATDALLKAYAQNETDEFVKPVFLEPKAKIVDDDVVIFMNFRADRARQLSRAFLDPNFSGFNRNVVPKISSFLTLTKYAEDIPSKIIFEPESLTNMLGDYLEQHQKTQLRIAETEKYAHVTFFFDGSREGCLAGEERILIPSKKVATYDLCPEMSAIELTESLIATIAQQKHDVIICNYANADMVGHTGNYEQTVLAIETLDRCLKKVLDALKAAGGEAIITADHGNAEIMFDEETNQPHTAHTLELVPFIYVGRPATITTTTGSLSDIAPTLLTLLRLPKPQEMTGNSLITLRE